MIVSTFSKKMDADFRGLYKILSLTPIEESTQITPSELPDCEANCTFNYNNETIVWSDPFSELKFGTLSFFTTAGAFALRYY